jgi:hypothetical protein
MSIQSGTDSSSPMRVSQVNLKHGRVLVPILPIVVVPAFIPLAIPGFLTMIASTRTMDVAVLGVHFRRFVTVLVRVVRFAIVPVRIVGFAVVLVRILGFAVVLVRILGFAVVLVRIVGFVVVILCIANLVIALPSLTIVLVFAMRVVIVHMRLVLVILVVRTFVFLSGMLDMNDLTTGLDTSLDLLDNLGNLSLKPRYHLLNLL